MEFENGFENESFDLETTRSESTDSAVEKLEQAQSTEKKQSKDKETSSQQDFQLEGKLEGETHKYRSSVSIEENVEKLRKFRNPESSSEGTQENRLQEQPEPEEIGNTKMARRVLESEWMFANREKAVQKEGFYNENGVNGSLAKLAVYEEDGKLKKDDELIQNAACSYKLEEEAEKLLEKGVSGRDSLKSWIDDARSMVENYEVTAAESIYGEEGNMVSDKELLNWESETISPEYSESTAVAD